MTHPPIGKAPNHGGGDLERAKDLVKEIIAYLADPALFSPGFDASPEDADLIQRLVRRVEEAENCKACGGKDVVCAKAWEKERDSLKSKLSEAEKNGRTMAEAADRFFKGCKALEEERDTLKSKLSEAEKAMEGIKSYADMRYEDCEKHLAAEILAGNVVKQDIEKSAMAEIGGFQVELCNALSRLRADGGGKGAGK